MLKVFVSYAREDLDLAQPVWDKLVEAGFDPWMDVQRILPGQNWSLEIERAFADANVILICMSPRSVNKRGFLQWEANEAMNNLRFKKPDDIYVIPIMVEPCDVPAQFSKRLQYIDITKAGSWERVMASLHAAATQQAIEIAEGVQAGPFKVYTELIDDIRENPNFTISLNYPRFESASMPGAARELSQIFSGRTSATVAEFRSWVQERVELTSGFESMGSDLNEGFQLAFANTDVVSISISSNTFFAGAAHGTINFSTFNFALQPYVMPLELRRFFKDGPQSLQLFSDLCIHQLKREYEDRTETIPGDRDIKYFNDGAGPQWENFAAFTFDSEKISVFFPPYQVSAYAMGPWLIDIPYSRIAEILLPNGPYTLAKLRS